MTAEPRSSRLLAATVTPGAVHQRNDGSGPYARLPQARIVTGEDEVGIRDVSTFPGSHGRIGHLLMPGVPIDLLLMERGDLTLAMGTSRRDTQSTRRAREAVASILSIEGFDARRSARVLHDMLHPDQDLEMDDIDPDLLEEHPNVVAALVAQGMDPIRAGRVASLLDDSDAGPLLREARLRLVQDTARAFV